MGNRKAEAEQDVKPKDADSQQPQAMETADDGEDDSHLEATETHPLLSSTSGLISQSVSQSPSHLLHTPSSPLHNSGGQEESTNDDNGGEVRDREGNSGDDKHTRLARVGRYCLLVVAVAVVLTLTALACFIRIYIPLMIQKYVLSFICLL
jgi:hypothetical protein